MLPLLTASRHVINCGLSSTSRQRTNEGNNGIDGCRGVGPKRAECDLQDRNRRVGSHKGIQPLVIALHGGNDPLPILGKACGDLSVRNLSGWPCTDNDFTAYRDARPFQE
jgi:hypothetical protein